jgi:hypothetical protein
MKRIGRLSALFAALALQACIIGGGGTGGEGLKGTLVDVQGMPVAGARVEVYSKSGGGVAAKSTVTDANGRFEFSGLPDGRYNVAASAQRQNTTLALFVRDVEAGENQDVGERELEVAGGLSLSVRGGSGEVVSGARCAVPASPYAAVSDIAGTCSLEGMAPGSYQVDIIRAGLDTTSTDSLEVESGVTHDVVTIVITTGPGLAGRWTKRSSGTPLDLHAVAWGENRYAAVGDSGVVLLSPDGIDWSVSKVQSPASRLRGVAWTGQQWVAVGRNARDSGEVFTSPTGETWTRRGTFPNALTGVIWIQSLDKLVAVGENGSILSSTNGIDWNTIASGSLMHFSSLTWTDSLIVVVGSGLFTSSMAPPGIVLTSPDGLNWTVQRGGVPSDSPGSIISLAHVSWSGTELLTVGGHGGVWASPTGAVWTSQMGGAPLRATAWTGERMVGIGYYSVNGSAGIWTLENGTHINRYAGEPSLSLNALTARPHVQLVVVGSGGAVLTSP